LGSYRQRLFKSPCGKNQQRRTSCKIQGGTTADRANPTISTKENDREEGKPKHLSSTKERITKKRKGRDLPHAK